MLNDVHPYRLAALRRYPDFAALAAAEETAAIAPDLPGPDALLRACRAIYSPDKEALGVVALEIEPWPQPNPPATRAGS
jgi:ASC-1-like (ASCH) protein